MLPKLFAKLSLVGIFTTLISCASPPNSTSISTPETPEETPTATGVIVISDVSNNPAKKIARYQPMADYLAANLTEFDIGIGEVKVASDLPTIANWLKDGEVDLYFDSPYPAMLVSEQSGAEAILRRWKEGKADYYGIIFTMRDRNLDTLADLQGKTIAFDEVSSTSGYMLPVALFVQNGLNPVEKNALSDNLSNNEVGYVFSDDDENTIQWVISGKVDAGAVDIGTFMEIPSESREKMAILAETDKVARHIVLVRPGMDPQMQQAIQRILVEMDRTPEGKAVLEQFEETAKFDDFPTDASLSKMRSLYEQVKNR